MAHEKLPINQLRDPFNEVTRKARRNLLSSTIVGIVIVKVGLIPTKINAFGIEFSQTNQNALLILLSLIIGYFLLTFIVYILSEIVAWRFAFKAQEFDRYRDTEETFLIEGKEDEFGSFLISYNNAKKATKRMFFTRVIIEALIPLVVSVYTITIVNTSHITSSKEPNNSIQSTQKNSATDE